MIFTSFRRALERAVVASALLVSARVSFAATKPIAATDAAVRWDMLYDFLLAISAFFFVLVVGAMLYFIVKYKKQPGRKPKYITGNHLLEGIWIAVPTILLLVIFGWGYSVYHDMTAAPMDAMEIRVIGKQWLWQFQYDNGRTTTGELFVPVNKPVKLIMTSQDVLHSFFIPNFRVKQDVVPGMYTSVWFEARIPGKHQVFCAEYCGTSHSLMLSKLIALDDAQWKAFEAGKKIDTKTIPDARDIVSPLADNDQPTERAVAQTAGTDVVASDQASATLQPVSLAMQGKQVFEVKGCNSCHSVDGTQKVGPTHKGIFGAEVTLSDGTVLKRDENYIRESIVVPGAKLVKGYGAVMPTYQGLINETEMNALIAYIKSVK